MLKDVIQRYTLQPVSDGHESIEFEIDQAEFFLQRMRGHEKLFQQAFLADDERKANRERRLYIYNFNAYLHSARTVVYFMRRHSRPSAEHRRWLEDRTRSQVFRAFMALRDFSTHERVLKFSLTYQTEGETAVQLHGGLIPSHIKINMMDHLVVKGAPSITVDPPDVDSVLKTEYLLYYSADERRKSLTFMCEDFLSELRAALSLGEKKGMW